MKALNQRLVFSLDIRKVSELSILYTFNTSMESYTFYEMLFNKIRDQHFANTVLALGRNVS